MTCIYVLFFSSSIYKYTPFVKKKNGACFISTLYLQCYSLIVRSTNWTPVAIIVPVAATVVVVVVVVVWKNWNPKSGTYKLKEYEVTYCPGLYHFKIT